MDIVIWTNQTLGSGRREQIVVRKKAKKDHVKRFIIAPDDGNIVAE